MKKFTLLSLFIVMFAFVNAQIHQETFDSDLGTWSGYTITGDDQVWVWADFGDPAGCAKMSGYAGGALDNEDWLISPVIDLSGATNTVLNFQEAINYGGPIETQQTVWVSTDYSGSGDPTAATWTELTVTGRASGGSWDFVQVDEVDLSSYDGESTVYIAMKYLSDMDDAATWEVDNITVGEPNNEPVITVTYPNGGEVFEQGETVEIAWTSENFTDNVKIELVGTSNAVIAESVENSGTYSWTIASDQAVADDYTIKVSDAADGDPVDVSDDAFSIEEPLNATFEGTFDTDIGAWTAYSATGDEVWEWGDFGTPPGCAAMSGYAGEALDNEDWLISSAIDLTEAADTKLNFEEAINYGTGNIDTEQEVMVSTDYSGSGDPSSATWTKLTVTGRAAGDSWDFVSVDEISLSDYDGFPSLFIAFKYTSTVEGAATWEVDNVVVTAESTIGIEENQNISDAVKVYPNPSEGMINIASSVIDKAGYKVFSITGEVVNQGLIQGSQSSINLSDMTNGIYTLQITENDKTAVKRIIIK